MSKYIIYSALAGGIIGIIPLVFGLLHSKRVLGIASFIISIISGAFLGLTLAIPLCCIFMYFMQEKNDEEILIKAKRKCPYCHYDIPMDAKKCFHCNRDIF